MILYFSGTGNSKYIAEKIAKITDDKLLRLNDIIKSEDYKDLDAKGKLVLVTPTYCWRIPKCVKKWAEKVKITNADKVWFVMDCGSDIGNAEKFNIQLCKKLGWSYFGTKGIVMPENYIAMFDVPDEGRSKAIIRKSDPIIKETANLIKEEKAFNKTKVSFIGAIKSGPVNPLFYSFCVKANPFKVDDKCISCGTCVKLCPTNSIELVNGKPVWSKDCTHCMACICHCPTEAIEYGKISIGKPRYHID